MARPLPGLCEWRWHERIAALGGCGDSLLIAATASKDVVVEVSRMIALARSRRHFIRETSRNGQRTVQNDRPSSFSKNGAEGRRMASGFTSGGERGRQLVLAGLRPGRLSTSDPSCRVTSSKSGRRCPSASSIARPSSRRERPMGGTLAQPTADGRRHLRDRDLAIGVGLLLASTSHISTPNEKTSTLCEYGWCSHTSGAM